MSIEFVIEGTAIPQGSKRHVGNGRMIEANPNLRAWRSVVTAAARQASNDFTQFEKSAGVEIELTFFMPKPKTVTRSMPTVKPDLDKLVRSILDGVTDSGIWVDDSQVVKITARKNYTINTPKVFVKISHFSDKSV